MIERLLSAPVRRLLVAFSRALLRAGINPNSVTIFGGVLVVLSTFLLIGRGHIVYGPVIVALFSLCDALDGSMARIGRKSSDWGSFLDSVVDRVVDASVLISVAVWSYSVGNHIGALLAVLLMPVGSLVSYARAKAEAFGLTVSRGYTNRTDRLFVVLLLVQLAGLGMPLRFFNLGLLLAMVVICLSVIMRVIEIRSGLLNGHDGTPSRPALPTTTS